MARREQIRTYCFVVMPDHFHWLMALEDARMSLSEAVRQVKARTTLELRTRNPAIGAVWQDGFHDRRLRPRENLKAAARYILMNPARAGLVRSLRQYPHWYACWL